MKLDWVGQLALMVAAGVITSLVVARIQAGQVDNKMPKVY